MRRDRPELLIDQIKVVEAERDAMLAAEQAVSPALAIQARIRRYRSG
ncbi:hypothetical protein [Mesorhizobium ciceri]|nr:hypothetical protein [Mesorhizobium ciceri]